MAFRWGRRARQRLHSPLEIVAPDRDRLVDRCRALTAPVYLGDNTMLCRILGLFSLYVDRRDAGFAGRVMLDGFWEIWATMFVARRVRPGMVAIDVGANFGYYTMLLGGLVGESGQVVAVEPNPAAVAMLRRSLVANGLNGRTRLYEAAAGAIEGGEALLAVPEDNPMNARLIDPTARPAGQEGALHNVRRLTVDSIAGDLPRVDFVKIDAEGAEADIIAGMVSTLTRHRPCLVLEFNANRCDDPARFLASLVDLYGTIGYVDDDGYRAETTVAQLTSERIGQDWLLCFERSGRSRV